MMEKFKFIESKEKFAQYGIEASDILYYAKKVDNIYLIRFEESGEWRTVEFFEGEVESNIRNGDWIIVD